MSQDRIAQGLEMLKKFPDAELMQFNLAQAYYDAGHFQAAAGYLRPLCAKKPEWMVIHILLGKCLLMSGVRGEAKRIFEHARDLAIAQHHEGPLEELTELLKPL